MAKGLLIDYRWCTGCHTCEIACKREHNLPQEEFGIKIAEFIWPHPQADEDWQHQDKWQYTYMPMPLDACDLCAERVEQGKLPSCVHHCQAQCLEFGELADLLPKLEDHPKQTLFHL